MYQPDKTTTHLNENGSAVSSIDKPPRNQIVEYNSRNVEWCCQPKLKWGKIHKIGICTKLLIYTMTKYKGGRS